MNHEFSLQRPICPFDDRADVKLRRMGLLKENGSVDYEAVAILSCVFAGMLFDDMCDFYQEYGHVAAAVRGMTDAAEGVAPKKKFLLICLQYDAIGRQLPDPIWWISGNSALVERFADEFLGNLLRMASDKEGR